MVCEHRDNSASLALACAHDVHRVRARQLATIEDRFKNRAPFWWEFAELYFLFGPQQNACAQPFGLYETFHECD